MKNIWIGVVVVVIIIGGGCWYWQSQQAPAMTMSDNGTPAAVDAANNPSGTGTSSAPTDSSTLSAGVTAGVSTAPMTATVTYNGNSFSPSTVTIAKGGRVTFRSTAGSMWVASNPHPVHTGYDGTSRDQHCAAGYSGAAPFDQCSSGTSFSFTFNKTGSWGYHDHMNTSAGGTVIVQ